MRKSSISLKNRIFYEKIKYFIRNPRFHEVIQKVDFDMCMLQQYEKFEKKIKYDSRNYLASLCSTKHSQQWIDVR